MQNYAGVHGCDTGLIKELTEAGIEVKYYAKMPPGEVPANVYGELNGWTFERAWYYWIATGPAIPTTIAETLHATHGQEVRVEGHCGCPSPSEYCGDQGVSSYHVDSQKGLNALAKTISSIKDLKDVFFQ